MKRPLYRCLVIKVVLVALVLPLTACIGPKLELLSQHGGITVAKTAGEDDYAYRYTVRVRNKGFSGRVRAIAELRTPEGQFYRERILQFDAGEDKELEFVFTEVSVLGEVLNGLAGETKNTCRFRYELMS